MCAPKAWFRWVTLLYWSAVALCALTELTHTATLPAATDWFFFALGGFALTLLGLGLAGVPHLPCYVAKGDYEHDHHGLALQWYLLTALTLLPTVLLAEFAWHYPAAEQDAWRCCRWDAAPPPALDILMLLHWHSLMAVTFFTWLFMGTSFFLLHLRLPEKQR